MIEDDSFVIRPLREIEDNYYAKSERGSVIRLDPQKVPDSLHSLIPFAEKWGISDDVLRGREIETAQVDDLRKLEELVDDHRAALNEWLAGPESYLSEPSAEYLAFSNMMMASEGL